MILTMGKRKKKTVAAKLETPKKEVPLVNNIVSNTQEDDNALPAFGTLPSRDLKKNLGCG